MELFGLDIFSGDRLELLDVLSRRIENGEKTFLVTVNAQIALRAKRDPVYFQILRNADLLIADGFGVKLALKLKYGRSVERYPGIELMKDLLAFSKIRGWSVYLLGSREEVVRKLALILEEEDVKVVGFHNGYFEGDGPIGEIRSSSPDIVFVAMGAPKQEEWIFANIDEFEKGIFMGVGGSFDVLSGFKKRAPRWIQKAGLEWLYRFLKEPKRRWKVPFEVMAFFFLVLVDLIRG